MGKKWTKEVCAKEALKYITITELRKYNYLAYDAIIRNRWKYDLCSHMPISNKWNKENCAQTALKYDDRSDFRKYDRSAYNNTIKRGWLDEISSHMPKVGDLRKRCVYVYEFSDNHAYIGLTYNINKRSENRLRNDKDSVTKHIKESELTPIIKQLTDYLDCETAKKTETDNILIYKNRGWNILNKTDRKSTRLNSSHSGESRMPSSA